MEKKCENKKITVTKKCMAVSLATAYAVGATAVVLTGCKNTVEKIDKVEETTDKSDLQAENSNLMAKEISENYPNKAVRVLESVKLQLGEDTYLNEIANNGSAEKAESQGEYVANLIKDVTLQHSEQDAVKVMRACGYKCLGKATLNEVIELYKNSDSLADLLDKMNKNGIGGGHLSLTGNTIYAEYTSCYCNIDDKNKKLNRCYCQCSCGWFEKLFSTVLEQPVNVELTESIKEGAESCKFEITFTE